jgi:hypothetical protein
MYLNVYVFDSVVFGSLAFILANLQLRAGRRGSMHWRTGC